ncbi:MAG TPA: alpha/beta fold hydrolase [Kofleriaceae bacterium]|jgi:pimeloyl-ACP methyl ester carboxylesterase
MISPDEWRARGDFAELRGRRMFFRREGGGEPLLLIHGYPTSSWDWAKIWPALVERYDVIAMDMLGFGESDKPRGHRYSIVEQTDLHDALLAKLGVGGYHVLAHDYGVSVGQELLARRAPLESIAFLNGGLLPEMHRPQLIQKLLASPLGPLVARLSTERTFRRSLVPLFGTPPSDDEIHAFWTLASKNHGRTALARLVSYMAERRAQRERWVGALLGATLPLVVINGSVDPVSGDHVVQRLLELRPQTTAVRLAGIGHYPQFEAPRAVLDAYLAFRA